MRTAGAFRVYYDFKPIQAPRPDRRLDPRAISIDVSENKEKAVLLRDGDLFTEWTTTNLMRGGERITLSWSDVRPIERIVLVHGRYHRDIPHTYAIFADTKSVVTTVRAALDHFELDRSRPRYGRSTRAFHFDGMMAREIAIEVFEPRTNRNWTVAEIEVYVSDAGSEGDKQDE